MNVRLLHDSPSSLPSDHHWKSGGFSIFLKPSNACHRDISLQPPPIFFQPHYTLTHNRLLDSIPYRHQNGKNMDFTFGLMPLMPFMPGQHFDAMDVEYWEEPAPDYENMPADDPYDVDSERRAPVEEDWVESDYDAHSVAAVPVRESTLAPSSRNPGYAERACLD